VDARPDAEAEGWSGQKGDEFRSGTSACGLDEMTLAREAERTRALAMILRCAIGQQPKGGTSDADTSDVLPVFPPRQGPPLSLRPRGFDGPGGGNAGVPGARRDGGVGDGGAPPADVAPEPYPAHAPDLERRVSAGPWLMIPFVGGLLAVTAIMAWGWALVLRELVRLFPGPIAGLWR
jgi:hypothetical protein